MDEDSDAQHPVAGLADTGDAEGGDTEATTSTAATEPSPPADTEPASGPVSLVWRALHLLVLTSFAIAQPLFSVLGDGPEFFVAHDSSTADILILTLGVVFVPALILIGIEGLVYLVNRKAAWWTHLVFVGGLAMLILAPVIDRSGASAWLVLILGAAGGVGVAALYNNLSAARSFVSILGIAPLAFAGLFLFGTDVSKIAFPEDVATSATPIPVEGTDPVVFLVFDEFPAQTLMTPDLEIDADLFPNFARLGEMSTWYRNAATVDERTSQSVPSIWTGRRTQPERQVPILQEHPENLFTMLQDAYTIQAVEPVTALCPVTVCAGNKADPLGERLGGLVTDTYAVYLNIVVPEDLRDRLPDVTRTWGNFAEGGLLPSVSAGTADEAYTQDITDLSAELERLKPKSERKDRGGLLEEFVANIDGDESTLYAMHSTFPHRPWNYLPSGNSYQPTRVYGQTDGVWRDDEWVVAQGLQRHILQVMYIDKVLGDLFDRLEEKGTLDETMIVLTADHGISFVPDSPPRSATADTFWNIVNVPLFVKMPFQAEAVISDANVDTIDIVPTIADVLGVGVSWDFDGRSLLGGDYRIDKTFYQLAEGEPMTVPGRRPDSLPQLETKTRLLGPDPTVGDVYAIGPHSEIVGQTVDSLVVRDPTGLEASLRNPEALSSYEPGQLNVPAWLEGEVRNVADGSTGLDLAFVVNGTVRAVTHTFDCCNRDLRFAVVLPEQVFETGSTQVDLFRIHEVGSGVELESISTRTFALDVASGLIVASDGTRISISEDAIEGRLSVAGPQGSDLVLGGWAADVDRGLNASTVLVFHNDELIFVSGLNRPREDVVEALDVPELDASKTGFLFSIRGLADEINDDDELRVFAVLGDVASEPIYPEDYLWGGS